MQTRIPPIVFDAHLVGLLQRPCSAPTIATLNCSAIRSSSSAQLLPHPQPLNRNITELDVRRAFTSFQLMTILEENHHSFLMWNMTPCSTRTPRRWWLPGPGPQADLQGGYGPALRPYLDSPATRNVARAGRPGVLHLRRAGSGQRQEGRGDDARFPGCSRVGILMRPRVGGR